MAGAAPERRNDAIDQPRWYEIRVKGHLGARWSAWFDRLTISLQEDGTTVLHGPVADQAALFGVLQRLRDLALPLISVIYVDPRPARNTNQCKEPVMTTTTRPRTTPHVPMSAHRQTALVVGVLFLITYATSMIAKFYSYPPLFDGGYIVDGDADTRVLWGAFLEMILIIANVGTAVALYPILKRQQAALALGFVTARVMESVFIAVGILSVLTVVTMRQDFAGAGDAESAVLSTVGDALMALQEWTFLLGPGFVVGVGNGLILGYLMYRSGLVPRGMAILGLVAGPALLVAGTAEIFGVIEVGSAVQMLLSLPEFFWELSFGVYLVVKGFKPSPVLDEVS